jgi:osmotically-inducible protein OsmY
MLVRNAMAGIFGGMVALSLAGAAVADSSTADGKLEERVETRFKDNKLGGLDVDVNNGVVTLSGEVATTAEKARAERVAKAAGAKSVENRVVIDADKTAARIEQRADDKKEAIDERAERQKEAVDRQAEAAKNRVEQGAVVAKDRTVRDTDNTVAGTRDVRARDGSNNNVVDPWVTTKVKTKILADDLLDKTEINVDTDRDGVVTLKGYVPTAAAETRALELARTTEGVRKVVDRLDVRAPVVK